MQYDPLSGSGTNDSEARIRELESDGIHRELAFPNALLGLMGWPDKAVRELCFRVYNEHIAELQERSNSRFYGVGMNNWWYGEGVRTTVAEMKELGLTNFWLPLKPGAGDEGKPIKSTRTEERRGRKEWGRTGRTRGAEVHER